MPGRRRKLRTTCRNIQVSVSSYKKARKLIRRHLKNPKVAEIDAYVHRKFPCHWDKLVSSYGQPNPDTLMQSRTHMIMLLNRNAVAKHDWATAARTAACLYNLGIYLTSPFWRTVFLVLMYHPDVTGQLIDDFNQMVLCLRKKDLQDEFYNKMLSLPKLMTDFEQLHSKLTEEGK